MKAIDKITKKLELANQHLIKAAKEQNECNKIIQDVHKVLEKIVISEKKKWVNGLIIFSVMFFVGVYLLYYFGVVG